MWAARVEAAVASPRCFFLGITEPMKVSQFPSCFFCKNSALPMFSPAFTGSLTTTCQHKVLGENTVEHCSSYKYVIQASSCRQPALNSAQSESTWLDQWIHHCSPQLPPVIQRNPSMMPPYLRLIMIMPDCTL